MVSNHGLHSKRTFLVLCISYFFDCYALFGFFAVLILFFSKHLGLPDISSYKLFGNFAALNYIAEFFGGFLGGRYLSFRLATVIGFITMLLGCVMLAVYQQMHTINIGLALFACGNGLVAPNLRNLVGVYYNKSSIVERDNGFTILHIFNLIGQIAGPISMAYVELIHVQWVFALTGVSALLSILNMLLNYHYLPVNQLSIKKKNLSIVTLKIQPFLKGLFGLLFLILFTWVILYYRDVKYVLEVVLGAVSIVLLVVLSRMERIKRIKIISVLLILAGFVVAEVCFRQAYTALKFFTNEYVERVVLNIAIPANVFQILEPILVLLIFPFILKMRIEFEKRSIIASPGVSLLVGLIFLSISFGFLVLGIIVSVGSKISVVWLVLFNGAMAAGELFIIPIVMSAVTSLSPLDWRGIMMGALALGSSLASYLSGWVGVLISPAKGHPALMTYEMLFVALAGFSFIGGLIVCLIWKGWSRKYARELQKDG